MLNSRELKFLDKCQEKKILSNVLHIGWAYESTWYIMPCQRDNRLLLMQWSYYPWPLILYSLIIDVTTTLPQLFLYINTRQTGMAFIKIIHQFKYSWKYSNMLPDFIADDLCHPTSNKITRKAKRHVLLWLLLTELFLTKSQPHFCTKMENQTCFF
jgi:hypothetical protein